MKIYQKTIVIGLICMQSLLVLAQVAPSNTFVGPGHDWLDPLNWSTGELPEITAAIAIPAFLRFVDINNASVEVCSIDTDGVNLNLSDSSIKVFGWGYSKGVIKLNPSSIEVNQMQMLDDEAGLSFGLGGNNPATPVNLGAGFYGNIKVVDIVLNGQLDVFLIYGFQPQVGDEFKLIDISGTRTGTFSGATEGVIVASFNGIGLKISYQGGDGNDVVLTAIANTATYIGTDTNWFDPNNWDTGVVPDATTNIIINNAQVNIDPSLSPTGSVAVNDISMQGGTLNLMDGSVFQYNKLIMDDVSLFDMHSSQVSGDELLINANTMVSGGFGVRLNPTTNDTRSIKITASTAGITMFLGGTIAASPDSVGMGHYATLLADNIELDGILNIDTIYGFQPQVGDIFEIIRARSSMTGQFNNLNEGDVVSSFRDVDLIISYQTNGDGSNSVILTSVQYPNRLTFVGNDGNWFNPANWADSNTGNPANSIPTNNDDIIIGGVIDVTINPPTNDPVVIRNLWIEDDRTLNIITGTIFNFQTATIVDGLLETHSSEIEGIELITAVATTNNTNSFFPGGWGCTHCGIVLGNPSVINIDSQDYNGILAVGIGGNQPAQNGETGVGYYATFNGDNIQLSGDLELRLFYGFTPANGDVFKILDVNNQLTGQFNGLKEGALVDTFENIGLYISYQGGDGNDVVLTTIEAPIFKNGFEN